MHDSAMLSDVQLTHPAHVRDFLIRRVLLVVLVLLDLLHTADWVCCLPHRALGVLSAILEDEHGPASAALLGYY